MAKPVFVGIDVAFAKEKHLPVSVCEVDGSFLKPFPRRAFAQPPRGLGNKEALEPTVRDSFAKQVANWLSEICREHDLQVQRIAIDAPSDYCQQSRNRRSAEEALDSLGISLFTTPTKSQFEAKIRAAQDHLGNGGAESHMPNANQIWMLIGFALFRELEKSYECIEVYPHATVKALGCDGQHKTTEQGFQEQTAALSNLIGISKDRLQQQLQAMCFGSRDDKLDAYLSAWVASLPETDRLPYGQPPHDVIWVPNVGHLKDPMMVLEDVLDASNKALWSSYDASLSGDYSNLVLPVVFPKYRRNSSTEIRVSEQEARAIVSLNLARTSYLTAVEVPTGLNYQQRGDGERSALFDLCVCDPVSADSVVNMEFKAGGCSTRAQDCSRIGKDLEKLIFEDADAVWFHTLEAVNSATIPELLGVVQSEIRRLAQCVDRNIADKTLGFHICVLRQGFSIRKQLELRSGVTDDSEFDEFFQIGLQVTRENLTDVVSSNGWKITRREIG